MTSQDKVLQVPSLEARLAAAIAGRPRDQFIGQFFESALAFTDRRRLDTGHCICATPDEVLVSALENYLSAVSGDSAGGNS